MDEAKDFANDIVTLYVIAIILPFFLRWVLDWVSSFFAWIFRVGYSSKSNYTRNNRPKNFRSFMAIITLPGTLLRVTIMFLFLRLRGWSFGIKYPGFVGKSNRGLISDTRVGFTFSMSPDSRRHMNFKDIALITLVGYLPLYLTYLMWINRTDNLDFIIYIAQGNLSFFWINVWYYYLLFALLIGGAPIPEETMVPVYYLVGQYPHLIGGIIGAYVIGFLISLMELGDLGYEGKRLGYIYFLLFSAILIFRIVLNQRQLGFLTKNRLDELLLEMDVIELI